jgi:hypothetical protein
MQLPPLDVRNTQPYPALVNVARKLGILPIEPLSVECTLPIRLFFLSDSLHRPSQWQSVTGFPSPTQQILNHSLTYTQPSMKDTAR